MTTSRCASRCPICCGSSVRRPGVLVGRSVPRVRCRRRDELPAPGHRDARHVGPDLQQELTRRRQEIPIVFITAHGDESVRPRCSREGPSSACSSHSARRPCSTPSISRCGEVSMTTMSTRDVTRGPYTVAFVDRRPSDRGPSHAGRHVDRLRRRRRRLGARIAGAVASNAGWQPETFASAQEFLSRPRANCSVLPGARRDAARAQRSRAADSSSPTGRTCRSSSSPATATCR